jgi:hypothetical protein
MKSSTHLNSFLQKDWQKVEIISQPTEHPLFDIENRYSSAGVLIWHILEDRIFLSEGLCRMLKMRKDGLLQLELLFWLDRGCELRRYLRNILDQVCSMEIADTSFKTKIPGIQKEIYGSVQLFDAEEMGIMDLMLICWEG